MKVRLCNQCNKGQMITLEKRQLKCLNCGHIVFDYIYYAGRKKNKSVLEEKNYWNDPDL